MTPSKDPQSGFLTEDMSSEEAEIELTRFINASLPLIRQVVEENPKVFERLKKGTA